VIAGERRTPVGQHPHEAPRGEFVGHQGFQDTGEAQPIARCPNGHARVVEDELAVNPHMQVAGTATGLGDVTGVIHAAGVSPSQAPPATILRVDLYGTAVILETFGDVIAKGGSAVVIASQSGHRLPALTAEQDALLATTPADELLALPMLQPDQVTDPLNAYQLSKRANALRVKAEAVRWGKRGARVNTISPGIIMTPLANDELSGPRGEGYRRMIELSPAGRAGTPDEVGTVGALLMGQDGAFITGSDVLMDGGVTASFFYGALAPES